MCMQVNERGWGGGFCVSAFDRFGVGARIHARIIAEGSATSVMWITSSKLVKYRSFVLMSQAQLYSTVRKEYFFARLY